MARETRVGDAAAGSAKNARSPLNAPLNQMTFVSQKDQMETIDVEVNVRIMRVEERPLGASFDTGPVVEETYTVDEALEIQGDSYRTRTKRLAETIRRKMNEKPRSP